MKHKLLEQLGAKEKLLDYFDTYDTLQEGWDKCTNGNWMLWVISESCGPPNHPTHRKFTAAKCRVARLFLKYFEDVFPSDDRPRKAVEVAEKYATDPNVVYDGNCVEAGRDAFRAGDNCSGEAFSWEYIAKDVKPDETEKLSACRKKSDYYRLVSAAAYRCAAAAFGTYRAYCIMTLFASVPESNHPSDPEGTEMKNRRLALMADEVRKVYPKFPELFQWNDVAKKSIPKEPVIVGQCGMICE